MWNFLSRYEPYIYAITRIVGGFFFACHGMQMFGSFGGFGGQPGATAPFLSLLWAGGLIELVGGVLIAVGFLTRISALVSSGQMAVAYFMAHQPQGLLPIQNKGELAAVYAFLFLLIAARGAGPLSVEGARGDQAPARCGGA